jgi:hypothetical protein
MALVAALIAIEKLLPWRLLATWSVTAVLLVLAVGVAASPADVPGLTVPSDSGSGSGMHMGGGMHHDDMKMSR